MILLHFPGSGNAFIISTSLLFAFAILLFYIRIKMKDLIGDEKYIIFSAKLGVAILFMLLFLSSFMSIISLAYTTNINPLWYLPIYIIVFIAAIWVYKRRINKL